MSLKNLPTDKAQALAELISTKPGQVSSMGLTPVDSEATLVLLSFDEGESVAEEIYPKDTLYFLIEGRTSIVFKDKQIELGTGQVLCVPANVEHAVAPSGAIKLLQIMA